MIRREEGDNWLLIPQVEHARLAGEIAAAWGNDSVVALPRPEWLVPTIRDHDEGWRTWAQSPTINLETGIPRDFTEMPMNDATELWTKSIQHCGRVPMGSVWVSLHFCHLAEMARESRADNADEVEAIDLFLKQQRRFQADQARQETLLDTDEFDQFAETGFRYLQMFDHISLWLCCTPSGAPYEFSVPGGGTVRFSPGPSNRFGIDPYPLANGELKLTAQARQIPATPLPNNETLRRVIQDAPTIQLHWVLTSES